MAAAREGRLYVDESRKTIGKEDVRREVRAYVARISVFVTNDYRSSVDELWEHILSCEEFVELMTPGDNSHLAHGLLRAD